MRVILALAMLAPACQNIDPETPTPAVVVPAPVIIQSQVTPTTPIIVVGTLPTAFQSDTAAVTLDPGCCPISFGVGEVAYAGTALTEKWFVDLHFDSTMMLWQDQGNSNEEVQLTPVPNSPGQWTDSQVVAAPYPFVPSLAQGPHTIQAFVSNAFANPGPSSAEPPYAAAADGGTVTSQTWVVVIGTCNSTVTCTSP